MAPLAIHETTACPYPRCTWTYVGDQPPRARQALTGHLALMHGGKTPADTDTAEEAR